MSKLPAKLKPYTFEQYRDKKRLVAVLHRAPLKKAVLRCKRKNRKPPECLTEILAYDDLHAALVIQATLALYDAKFLGIDGVR